MTTEPLPPPAGSEEKQARVEQVYARGLDAIEWLLNHPRPLKKTMLRKLIYHIREKVFETQEPEIAAELKAMLALTDQSREDKRA